MLTHPARVLPLLLLAAAPAWADAEEAKEAFSAEYGLTLDLFKNTRGGLSTGSRLAGNLDMIFSWDTEAAGWWKGGTFQAYVLGNFGGRISQLAGETQLASHIEAPATLKLYEFWYEHRWFDDQLAARVGMMDFNANFYTLESGALYLNSSMGIPPDLGQLPISAFPTTSLGFELRWQDQSGWYGQGIVLDGVPGDPDKPWGTQVILKGSDGLFTALEAGFAAPGGEDAAEGAPEHPWKLGVGAWHRTTNYSDFAGVDRGSASGWYLLGEYWFADRVSLWAKGGRAPGDRQPTETFLSAGVNWRGPIPGRPQDTLGFAVAQNRWSQEFIDFSTASGTPLVRNETVYELTYAIAVNDHLSIQPDLQYVARPGGDPAVKDALLFALRLNLSW